MIPLNVQHRGENLAAAVVASFCEFNIETKVFSIVGDNASNNDTMMESLVDRLPIGAWLNLATRIRCLAHILNLIIKAILSCFQRLIAGTAPDSDDQEDDTVEDTAYFVAIKEADPAVEASGAETIDSLDLETAAEVQDLQIQPTAAETAKAQSSFRKLLRLGHRIFNSGLLRKNVVDIAVLLKLTPRLMKRAVPTRWNTVTDVIESGLDIAPILDRLCTNSTGRKNIRSLLLSKEDWQIMAQLFNLLNIFRDATNEVSTNCFARLHVVIPIIDIITQHLEDAAKCTTTELWVHPKLAAAAATAARSSTPLPPQPHPYSTVVRFGALKGLALADKYYAKTDEDRD